MEDSSFNLPILPTELINEILLRLPVKSLLQFRCVSKSWLALITSPQFIKTHLSLSANNKDQTHHRLMMGFSLCENLLKDCSFRSLFFNSVTVASDLNYPMELRNKLFSLVGSVNGLICLVSGTEDLFLWNPSIQKYKKLANSRHKYSYGSPLYGFGYDEFHDDYKVVVVGMFRIYGERRVDSKIYSLKGNFWRKINYCQDEVYSSQSGIFVNGKLHWTAEISTTGIRTGDKLSKIICIDLADENWGNIDLPCNGKNDHLGVLGNDLSIFSHDIAVGVDVWVMKEYGLKGSWTQMFTIKYPDHPRHLYFPSLFLSRSVGEILVGCGSVFMIYNAKYDSFKFLEVINFDQWWGKAEIYIESLVSPLSMDGAEDATKTKGKQRVEKQQSSKKIV